jgi:hypothetical protein
MSEQIMLFVPSVFKGTTFNKKMRLDHESLRHPETRILKYHGYIAYLIMTLDKIDKSNKSFNNTKSIPLIIQRVGFCRYKFNSKGICATL